MLTGNYFFKQITMFRILEKENIIAGPEFNRWLVPPAALAIHLCIGMAYGFSVFWLPLSQAVGINQPITCADDGFIHQLFTTTCDWKVSMLGWMYTLFFVFLGSAAAIWGGWLEHAGPRKAGVVAACCWCGGLLFSAWGIHLHQLWMLWLGSGIIGGIGLGIGYISPISTLIKWFPDHRGMATGMAIMGFGGGAMIGSPLANRLMNFFATSNSVGVWETLVTLAIIYFIFMLWGAFAYRIPQPGWKPKGWQPAELKQEKMITRGHVHVNQVMKTNQFWLLWMVLFLNVTAGIGILGMASPLLQEIFGGKLIGINLSFSQLNESQLKQIAGVAAGFTGLLSFFNIIGRIGWSSLSDSIGRKNTYWIFLSFGCLLYLSIPYWGSHGELALFVLTCCLILSMYGGGFATIPAYLADLFGTQMVSAIHGRLLTAWATAGVAGPVLVNYLREYQLAQGADRADVYNTTMYILGGMLTIGIVCNALVKPVDPKFFMPAEDLIKEKQLAHEPIASAITIEGDRTSKKILLVLAAWLAVGLPLMWGVYLTLKTAMKIFS
jgi:MFS family permease